MPETVRTPGRWERISYLGRSFGGIASIVAPSRLSFRKYRRGAQTSGYLSGGAVGEFVDVSSRGLGKTCIDVMLSTTTDELDDILVSVDKISCQDMYFRVRPWFR